MCDLIDLNSPDRKGLLGTRLASPLIPVPSDPLYSNNTSRTNEPRSLVTGKRDSLENNPFDMVLHKTTEYIQKKDDPFEIALENALKSKRKKNIALRTYSVDFTDDFSPKNRRHTQVLKMNQTLDESLISQELNLGTCRQKILDKIMNEDIPIKLKDSIVVDEGLKTKSTASSVKKDICKIPVFDIQNADLSILNQSLMDDTFLESSSGAEKNLVKSIHQEKISMCTQKDTIVTERDIMSNANLNVPKLRRSYSQGEKSSSKKLQHLNQISQSTIDTLKIGSVRGSSISSISSLNSVDPLNEGFLKSQCSESSIFSSLSNISAITKLNSVSSMNNSSMVLSNGTINRTFLESCSLEKSGSMISTNKKYFSEENGPALPMSASSVNLLLNELEKTPPELIGNCNKHQEKSSEIHIPESSVKEKTVFTSCLSNDPMESVTMKEKLNEQDTVNNKLIDVDVFMPETNGSKECDKNSISDTSSDSVFIEGSKVNKSILQEAKVLAKTFEELALRTSSESSIDDLISNNPLWVSELLPAFDDEAMVDNLIELPKSPNTSNGNLNLKEPANNHKNCDSSNKMEENIIKSLETELVETISVEKKITAATLLLDLKKLIKAENNTEVNVLLEHLEKALGVECKNNTELLTTYLNTTNNLAKSPKKLRENLNIIKNVTDNTDVSKEENLSTELTEDTKDIVPCDNVNLNNSNMNKCTDNSKECQKAMNNDLKNVTLKEEVSTDNSVKEITKERNGSEHNTHTKCEKFEDSFHTPDSNLSNEKMAMNLLTTLAKLLTGQTEEQPAANLLQNLGHVLNSVSNHYNVGNKVKTENVKIQRTPKKCTLKSGNKIHSSVLSQSVNRLSLDLEIKKKSPVAKSVRRSISVSHNLPVKLATPLQSKSKNTSQLKEVKKRFPSDPGFINSVSNRKSIDSDISKTSTGKGIRTKSITISNIQKEKSTMISDRVKNKLKKKVDIDVVGQRGPMKAVLPIGSMQKKESLGKKAISPVGTVTPPKSHKIVSSTPNPMDNEHLVKKSPRSKPVASSTPDALNSNMYRTQSHFTNSPKKRNFSCDISPVTTRLNPDCNDEVTRSPRRMNKLPTPKKTTPKRRVTDSSIPKSRISPIVKKPSSLFDVNQYEQLLESPQRSLNRRSDFRKPSPVPLKSNGSKVQQSPLRDSNKLSPKVKPLNLVRKKSYLDFSKCASDMSLKFIPQQISKLRRHSNGINIMEKENAYI